MGVTRGSYSVRDLDADAGRGDVVMMKRRHMTRQSGQREQVEGSG